MTKLNCPNCKRTRKFTITEKEKYKCEKCVGKGIKNRGAAFGAAIIVIAGVAHKIYKTVKK